MANPYYDNNFTGAAGQTARAEQVNSELESIESAFDVAYDSDNCSLRGQSGETMNRLPAAVARAGLFLRFDASGQPVLVQSGFTWRGDWAVSTIYALGDVVRTGTYGSLYICTTPHTSAASGTIDLTKFEVLIDLTGSNIIRNELKTGSFTAVVGGDYMVDSSAGNVTITLPAAPTILDAPINITHVGGSLASGQLITVARNGLRIMGLTQDLTFDKANASISLMYCDATRGWRLRVLA